MFAITERLLLRPGWSEDAPALARAIGERAVARMLARVPWPYREEDAAAWLALPLDPLRPRLVIASRASGELVGGIGLEGGKPELGYWLARAWWGRGLATEAGRAMLAIADGVLRLPQVRAAHALDNPASARVLAKLGFRPAGEAAEMPSAGRGGVMMAQPVLRVRPGPAALPIAA